MRIDRYRARLFAALCAGGGGVRGADVRAARCRRWWPWQQPVRLGLDLQGGTHLLYQVEIEKAIDARDRADRPRRRERAARRRRWAPSRSSAQGADAPRAGWPTGTSAADGKTPAAGAAAEPHADRVGGGDAADFTLALSPREETALRERFVEQALQILRNRIDQFGVSEPTIQAQGTDEIVVQLPGIQDPQRAKDLIGRTALLEFKLVASGRAGRHGPERPGPASQVVGGTAGDRRRQYLRREAPDR